MPKKKVDRRMFLKAARFLISCQAFFLSIRTARKNIEKKLLNAKDISGDSVVKERTVIIGKSDQSNDFVRMKNSPCLCCEIVIN